ncbi:MAG: hypothetical protein ACRDNK_09950 [Solirubrobacteraceae bacterium]
MSSLEQMTAFRLRVETTRAGWTRDPVARPDRLTGAPVTLWRGPDSKAFVSGVPESMPDPLRLSFRGTLISWMTGRCPLCGETERQVTETDEELKAGEQLLSLGLSPITEGATGIAHSEDCPIAPVSAAAAVLNAFAARATSAGTN